MNKKEHGWVLEMYKSDPDFSGFYQRLEVSWDYAGPLKTAEVYPTRAKARFDSEYSDEVVRKVELDRNGDAVRVIPGR